QTISLSHKNMGEVIGLDVGFLRESKTLLGSYSSGAFSFGENNTTAFAKVKLVRKLFGETSMIGAVTLGRTNVGTTGISSLFSNFTPILSRSFVTGLQTRAFGGMLTMTYSNPIGIISGTTQFEDANGNVRNISLRSTKQEQDYGVSFARETKNGTISFQGAYILNQNNLDVKPTLGFFGTWGREI
ncbi:MAG: hypothetical protein ACI9CD_001176, partial [Candidatus Deianiraeaceae bacterium]